MLVWEKRSAPNISSFLIGLWLNLTNQNTFYIVGTKTDLSGLGGGDGRCNNSLLCANSKILD